MCVCAKNIGETGGEHLTEKEYLYFISHVTGVGAVSIFKLREYFGSFRAAWTAGEKEIRNSGALTPKRVEAFLQCRKAESTMEKEYEDLEKNHIRYIAYFEDEYPKRLRPYHDRPAGLFAKGKLPDDDVPAAAIVGARNCTEYGRQMAEKLAYELGENGIQIISGLALGVDGAAHKGCLDAGGDTYAVLGCGVNVCYPKENYRLFARMETQGGILSEFVPGTAPAAMNFPMRNRIISGLADIVIITEAREKSGSLITADLALDQGKDIFAVPGRVSDPLSAGCNRLLQMGASVCLSSNDIFEYFGVKYEKKLILGKFSEKRLAKKENMVYSFLDSRPKHLEEIVKNCQISVAEALETLLTLELDGLVISAGNQYYCRKM